jgi:hypothetical protein
VGFHYLCKPCGLADLLWAHSTHFEVCGGNHVGTSGPNRRTFDNYDCTVGTYLIYRPTTLAGTYPIRSSFKTPSLMAHSSIIPTAVPLQSFSSSFYKSIETDLESAPPQYAEVCSMADESHNREAGNFLPFNFSVQLSCGSKFVCLWFFLVAFLVTASIFVFLMLRLFGKAR